MPAVQLSKREQQRQIAINALIFELLDGTFLNCGEFDQNV